MPQSAWGASRISARRGEVCGGLSDADGWDECQPVYLDFPGREEPTAGIREWDKLAPAPRAYLRALEELSDCRIVLRPLAPTVTTPSLLGDPVA